MGANVRKQRSRGRSVGLEFGHHLGLPQALSGLPLSPLIPRYHLLVARQRALGFRHIGETLMRDGGSFRVLDGVFVQRSGRGWRRVDREELRRLRGAAGDDAGDEVALLGQLEEIHSCDPAGLRRVLLYQLIELLQDHPRGGRPGTAVSLGVDRGEAEGLAHAARIRPRLGPQQRAAAETLQDAWDQRLLRRAGRLVQQLPPATGQDPSLARLAARIAARRRTVDGIVATARRLESGGDTKGSRSHYLRAARMAGDDRRALRGLVRTHAPSHGSDAALSAELGPESVRLDWAAKDADGRGADARGAEAPDARGRSWRVIRIGRDGSGPASVTEIGARVAGESATDEQAPLGSRVTYAVLPVRDGIVDGPPLVSRSLLVAPEVTGLRTTGGRGRVDGEWRRPPGAVGVTVVRTGPDGRRQPVTAQADGFSDRELPPGEHRYRISCRYRTAAGEEIHSPGVEARCTVSPWPDAVRGLTAVPGAAPGSVKFVWTGGEDAEVRLVEWPGAAPRPGEDLPQSAAALPAALSWPVTDGRTHGDGVTDVWPAGPPGEYLPPPGTATRVTAVAVLGGCAVAGPSVLVEVLQSVTGLSAERTGDGLARVTFDWPADAGQVVVRWRQDGRSGERRIARSVFLREGLRIPVGPWAAGFRAEALARTAEATVIAPAAAEAVLPADIAIAYRLAPGSRWPGRRRPATVHVTLSAPTGEADGTAVDHTAAGDMAGMPDIPEFVLVARASDADRPVRPRHAADGTTVLRLSGEELRRAGSVRREIDPAACRPPYALRGFLLGEQAASVRLEEPSPATLVVR